MILLIAALALAGEHDAAAPAPVRAAVAAAPDGPPRDVYAQPGDDLAEIVRVLPGSSRLRLAPGVHQGPLVVDRPLEIVGEPGAVIAAPDVGSAVVIAAPDTIVRGLSIRGGSGTFGRGEDAGVVVGADRAVVEDVRIEGTYLGIDVRMAREVTLRGNTILGDPDLPFGARGDGIRLWEAHGSVVRDNVLAHVRDLVVWYSEDNLIADNVVRDSRYGTHLMHASRNRIAGNTFDHDVVGVFVMYSHTVEVTGNTVAEARGRAGVGLGFKESDAIVVRDNRLLSNTTGIYIDNTPHRIGGTARFEGNLIAANETGVRFHGPQKGAVFTQGAFRGNGLSVAVDGGGDATGSVFERNHFSEYVGYDLDRDGLGDLPHAPRSLVGALRDRRPALAFFTGTPANALLDLFARAFPMFAPRPVLVDPTPAMEIP